MPSSAALVLPDIAAWPRQTAQDTEPAPVVESAKAATESDRNCDTRAGSRGPYPSRPLAGDALSNRCLHRGAETGADRADRRSPADGTLAKRRDQGHRPADRPRPALPRRHFAGRVPGAPTPADQRQRGSPACTRRHRARGRDLRGGDHHPREHPASVRRPLPSPGVPAAVDGIAAVTEALLSRLGEAAGKVMGTGVVVSGDIDTETGVVRMSPRMNWSDVPLAACSRPGWACRLSWTTTCAP